MLERSAVAICTARKPFAVLQCPKCFVYLYLFGKINDPLVVSGDKLRGSLTFSDAVDELLRLRDEDRKRKRLRARKK
jgi:hypothetical protein